MTEIENIKSHLDAVAGAQMAYSTVISVMLTPYRGNQLAIETLRNGFEAARANLLGSISSDQKIAAFDGVAETILQVLHQP